MSAAIVSRVSRDSGTESHVQLEVSSAVAGQVRLLERAWNVSTSEAIRRLLERFVDRDKVAESGSGPTAPDADSATATQPGPVPIHVVYQGVRIDAAFEPVTRCVEVRSEPLTGM